MLAHDWLNGFGCLVGVVERDGRDVVVEDVGFNNPVEELAANETEFAVDGCGGATGVGPGARFVVRERGVGVLEVRNGDCDRG